jgi:hypothetical protein
MSAASVNLKVEQGADFYRKLTIKDADGVPIDLTENVFRGQIRKNASDQVIMAAFTFSILDQSIHTGQVEMKLSAAETAQLPAAKQTSAKRIVRELAYDVERVSADGSVERLIEGCISLSPEVTK